MWNGYLFYYRVTRSHVNILSPSGHWNTLLANFGHLYTIRSAQLLWFYANHHQIRFVSPNAFPKLFYSSEHQTAICIPCLTLRKRYNRQRIKITLNPWLVNERQISLCTLFWWFSENFLMLKRVKEDIWRVRFSRLPLWYLKSFFREGNHFTIFQTRLLCLPLTGTCDYVKRMISRLQLESQNHA